MNQGTPEWLAARAGHVTASRLGDVMATVKVGEAAGRVKYRWQLVTERLTTLPADQYENEAMRWGKEQEPFARMAYEAKTGRLVEEVGFIPHPTKPWIGCSPDGLIDGDGGAEIKCPFNSVVHVQTLHGGMPPEHRPQVQGGMWITERDWWDFISFDPRMPADELRLYVERIPRDDVYIKRLAEATDKFLEEVDKHLASVIAMAASA